VGLPLPRALHDKVVPCFGLNIVGLDSHKIFKSARSVALNCGNKRMNRPSRAEAVDEAFGGQVLVSLEEYEAGKGRMKKAKLRH
jgi:hypothetical protein